MKYLLLLFIIFNSIGYSQAYRDVYTSGIFMLSDEDNPDNSVLWVSPTINSTVTFTLPPNFGQVGYAMTSLGNGSLTWTDVSLFSSSAAGLAGQIQFNNNGSFGASSNLFWNNPLLRLGIGTSLPAHSVDVNNSLGVNVENAEGGIILYSEQGATDYQYYITAPANLGSSVTFTWPTNFTAADQIMTTDGNGNLSWSTSWVGTNGDCVGQGVEPDDVGDNSASGGDSFIGGGDGNQVTGTGTNGFIGGGVDNSVGGANSGILAGQNNQIQSGANNSLIGGGRYNVMKGSYSVIFSGEYNTIDSDAQSSFIGAGRYNYINSDFSAIGAGESNTISDNSDYSFIGSGSTNHIDNNSPYSGILAGQDNTIGPSASYSAIGGGQNNEITGSYSFIGAGSDNTVSGSYSTILGGEGNEITGSYGFIGGGLDNTVSGDYAIALGRDATASGDYSVAFGRGANAAHDGAFVFADANSGGLSSSAVNQFTMRFTNEITFFTNTGTSNGRRLQSGQSAWGSVSDRNLKTNILELNPKIILDRLNKLNIFSWSYKGYAEKGIRNYGPMAQDFYELFGEDEFGKIGSDKTINSVHLSSLGIVGIQALKEKVTDNNLKISELEYKNQLYREKLEELKKLKSQLENKIEEQQK